LPDHHYLAATFWTTDKAEQQRSQQKGQYEQQQQREQQHRQPKFIGSLIRSHHHERDNYSTKIPDATSESVDMNQFKIEQK